MEICDTRKNNRQAGCPGNSSNSWRDYYCHSDQIGLKGYEKQKKRNAYLRSIWIPYKAYQYADEEGSW